MEPSLRIISKVRKELYRVFQSDNLIIEKEMPSYHRIAPGQTSKVQHFYKFHKTLGSTSSKGLELLIFRHRKQIKNSELKREGVNWTVMNEASRTTPTYQNRALFLVNSIPAT